jgi:hypothetical protein
MSDEQTGPTLLDDGATCPFVYCRAAVETRTEMRHPGPSAGSIKRILPHEIVGAFDFWGPCPASLMALPLNDAAHAALSEIRRAIDRAYARRQSDAEAQRHRLRGERRDADKPIDPAAGPGGNRPPGRHSRWPRDDGRSW